MPVFVFAALLTAALLSPGNGQTDQAVFPFPLSSISFESLIRSFQNAPQGRRPGVVTDIRVAHFWRDLKTPTIYRLANLTRLLDSPHFDINKPTVLYIHGYVEMLEDISIQTVVQAYLKRCGYNIIVLDWSNIAYGNYIVVAQNVAKVSKAAAQAFTKLVKNGVSASRMHCVGHSLGAHICGQIGRGLKGTIARITGLDPALPGFYPPSLGAPLNPRSAVFVDAIHTDGGRYGTPLKTATADFWPNGGLYSQPGCPNSFLFLVEEFCHHWRSWRYWAESVTGGEFLARKCDNYDTFLRGGCQDSPVVKMGLDGDTSISGNFYLRTASSSPYALAIRGAS